jgi:hypothetical protein
MQFNLQEFYADLQGKGIIFCFSGPVSQEVIEGVGETLRQRMELQDTDLNTSQKVFSIFVEQMQNIVNYSAERVVMDEREEGDIRSGVLVVGTQDKGFYVLCGNKVRNEQVGPMKEHLELLVGLDKNGLKSLYRERRKAAAAENSKGAGLGFIDIARRASRPIEFEFVPVDQSFSFFSLMAVI